MSLYEAMFVLDNDAVRAGWADAKGIATGILEKHGAKVHTARRWDERRLAYPIRGKQRGTYLLTFVEAGADAIGPISRDLELEERVLRYLILSAEGVPAGEDDLSKAEQGADFVVPEPPRDDEPRPARVEEPAPEKEAGEKAEEKPAEGEAAEKAPADEAEKPAEAQAQPEGASAEESKPALATEAPKES